MDAKLRRRLFSRLVIDPSGCLMWTGGCGGDGYGHIRVQGTMRLVHRVIFEFFAGPIPDHLELDHLCRVRRCANVAHLEPVTKRVNTLRGIGLTAVNAAKTHCPSGHPYDEANTYLLTGSRYCRPCNREAARRYRQRRQVR